MLYQCWVSSPPENAFEWLVLVHQIPPKPAYLRVKIGRRLTRIGAVALKNSVYLLPALDSCQEDFQWVLREVKAEGGEATLMRAEVVDGLDTDQVRGLFNTERERDYQELSIQARALLDQIRSELESQEALSSQPIEVELARIERRLADVVARDFFGARGGAQVSALLFEARQLLTPASPPSSSPLEQNKDQYKRRTWVTRQNIHVDRIASAWLIRHFIDPEASFKFVAPKGYTPGPSEVCFDMFEAEFTHEGNACTFEVLVKRFGLEEPGLSAIAELVHDLDIKDDRYNRPETAGFAALLHGITTLYAEDEARLTHAATLLESLRSHFATKPA